VTLFSLAALWRGLYLARLSLSPLAGSMLDDARIYWTWSERIAQGHLLGSNPFFLAPLYPYVLGLLRVFLDSPSTVLIVQALWGAGAVALLTDAARRLTRPTIAAAIGVILCFYEMAVFFDGLLLTESLLFFLGSLLLWWVVGSDWKAAPSRAAGAVGVLVGLLSAGRATSALLLIPAGLLLWDHPQRARSLLVLLAGFMLIAAPTTLHNYVVAREWIPFAYNLGFNLHAGNNARASGTFTPVTGRREGQPRGLDGGVELDGRDYLKRTEGLSLGPSASSTHWARRAGMFITDEPLRALQLVLVKAAMLWNAREYPQIENVEEYRALAGPLGLPFVGTFALLGALALMGGAFAWSLGPAARFTVVYAAVITLGTLPFFVVDRYRHHLVPACAILAAVAVQRLWPIGEKGRRHQLSSTAALALGLLIVHLPTPGPSAERRTALLAENLGARWFRSGWEAAGSGRLEEAERDFVEAVKADPRQYDAWGSLIRIQVQAGRVREASESFARARAAGMPEPATHVYAALFAALSGDLATAESELQRAPADSLDDPILKDVMQVTRRILSSAR
jgi:tetratricopeptide (TPR) repeat protein